MAKIKSKWRAICILVWILLFMPTLYMYIAYTHDEEFLELVEEVYEDDVVYKGFINPYMLFDTYDRLLMMPHYLYNEKHIQMGLFEGYEITEELSLTSAMLSLEDELEARWDFVYHKDEFPLWSLPNDERLYTLVQKMLSVSFVDQDNWQRIDYAMNSADSSAGPLDAYAECAMVLGYDNVDADSWLSYIEDVFMFYYHWTLLYLAFLVYSAFMFVVICVKVVKRILTRRKHEKNRR